MVLGWWAIDYARRHMGGTMEKAYLDCRPRLQLLLLVLVLLFSLHEDGDSSL